MMAPQFSRPLQTALDDTQGTVRGRTVVLEPPNKEVSPRGDTAITGYASMKNKFRWSPVYDATKLAPDIGMLLVNEQLIWVEANSIFLKGGKVVRPTNVPEVFTIWDYEGKLESQGWSDPVKGAILAS